VAPLPAEPEQETRNRDFPHSAKPGPRPPGGWLSGRRISVPRRKSPSASGSCTARPRNVTYRIGRIADLIEGRWLDLGCADGGYAAELLRQGVTEVIGVDAEQERVAQATASPMDRACGYGCCQTRIYSTFIVAGATESF
jgi:SAM-dependent methyltransferase